MPKRLIVCSCTSPKRNPKIIDKAIKKFIALKSEVLLSIYKINSNPKFNIVKLNKNNQVEIFLKSKKKIFNRQEVRQAYQISTNIYVLDPKFVLKKKITSFLIL